MIAKLGVAIFALITFPCTHAEVPGVAIHKPKVDQIFQPGETIVVSVSVSGFKLPADGSLELWIDGRSVYSGSEIHLQLSVASLPPGQHVVKVRIVGHDGIERMVQGNEPRTFSVSKGATLQDTLIVNTGETTTLAELRAHGVDVRLMPPETAQPAQVPVFLIHAAFLLLPGRFDLHAKCLVAEHAVRYSHQDEFALTPFGKHVWATLAGTATSDPSSWDDRRFLHGLQDAMHVEASRPILVDSEFGTDDQSDGAICAAVLRNQSMPCAVLPSVSLRARQDEQSAGANNVPSWLSDWAMLEYIRASEHARLLVIFPTAGSEVVETAESYLASRPEVVRLQHRKFIDLPGYGPFVLSMLLSEHCTDDSSSWVDGHRVSLGIASSLFRDQTRVLVYVFDADSGSALELDQYLHQAAGRQLHVIPTKRNATLAISSLLLGEATLRALSASTPQYLPHYKQTVRDFLGDITGRAYIPDPDLLVVGSAVLSAMGRRDSTSLSVIARRPEKLREGISPRVQCVNALFTPEEVQDLLEDARFHVHFDSLRFLSLDRHAGWPVERLQALGLNAADVAELQPLGHYLSLPKPPARHMRVFGLVVLRNDAKTVEMYLKALAPYVDGVLIIDDSSTDGTLAIVRQVAATCKVKMIIQHQSSELIGSPWKVAMLRNVLLRRGRALGGTHFVHLHSDQVLTMNTLSHGNWKRRLEDLGPGDSLCYSAITLWKARHYLRLDWLEHYYGGVKSDAENQRCVAFADEAGTVFTEEFPALNNIPTSLRGRKRHFPTAIDGILELHALAYRNYNLKWFWYKVMERLMYPDRPSEEINQRYYTRLLWAGQRTRQASVDLWYYDFMDMDKLEVLVTEWREAQVLKIFEERGRATFSDLGVLDLDWGFGLGVAPSEFEIVPPSCLKPGRVALTIVYTTKRPGGYDVVLNALGQQTSRDFELVCVDELAPYREHQIREMAAARGVTVTFIQKSKVPSEKRRYKIQNAYNSGLLMVRGQLVSILNDYAWLPSRFVEETIKFYSNSLHCKALLGYPEIWFRPPGEFTDDGKMMSSPVVQFDAIARNDSLSVFNPPLDRSPLEAGWERVPKSIMYPLDALPTHIKSHWFWDGGVYTGPLQMYLDLNGFDEDLDHGSDHQAENMSDRACFLGYKMYVAGIDLAHQQINNQFFGQAETWNRYGAVNNYVRWGAKWKAIKEGNWPVPTQNQYNLTQALLELGWTPHW